MDTNRNSPPVHKQLLWVTALPDTVIETQVIYILTQSHEDIDVNQTLYSMWTYDGSWHLLGGDSIVAITITQEQYELLITNNALLPGQTYIIEDLIFTYNIGGTNESATYTQPLLVTALTGNTLLPIAYPINHPNDWVEVDWSIPAITFRHDTLLNNHVGYDYRNKLNRRYKLNVTNIFSPSETFEDWFLPSIDALVAINTLLVATEISNYPDVYYWSSSEDTVDGINNAQCLKLDGISVAEIDVKSEMLAILPIRSFNVIEDTASYEIGNIGPAKGFIFNIVDNLDGSFTYYEVSSVPFNSNIWSDVLEWVHTGEAIEESQDNTNLIVNIVGSVDSSALDCVNYTTFSHNYVVGDVVVDEYDRIYIAVKNDTSISLDDGLWYLYPCTNNTYEGGDYSVMVQGQTRVIPYDINDFRDILGFDGCSDITTGRDFTNNIVTDCTSCMFGNEVINNIFIDSGKLTIGTINKSIVKNGDTIEIKDNNYYILIFNSSYIHIQSINTYIYIPSDTHNLNIGDNNRGLMFTRSINNVKLENQITNLYHTDYIYNLDIKSNVNLVNLEQVIIDILKLNFFKTIEVMYDPINNTKQMLWYFDANSSLPVFVELIQGN